MRRQDRENLDRPYGDEGFEDGLQRRLGVYLPVVRALADEILADLDPLKHGVGWWSPHPGTKRRILISDYLWQLVTSIQLNLREAALHLLEARGAWEAESLRVASALHRTSAGVELRIPQALSPQDHLPEALGRMHVAGFFRALGSTLDCLGGAVIGVAGLKYPILKADLKRARETFQKVAEGSDGTARQLMVGRHLEKTIAAAGPDGWLDWATQYRNMLVHRGRRTDLGYVVRDSSRLVDARGRELLRGKVVSMLHVDPNRSEIEVLMRHDMQQYIEEDGGHVLDAVLESTRSLVGSVATKLLELWGERRSDPNFIIQPHEQWPHVMAPSIAFTGYSPGSLSLPAGGDLTVSPAAATRLKAASLLGGQRAEWDEFD